MRYLIAFDAAPVATSLPNDAGPASDMKQRHRAGRWGSMFYQLYELNHAAVQPFRAYADAVKLLYSNPLNPLSHTPFGRSVAAAAELFERTTRRYGKPTFGIDQDDGRLEAGGGRARRSSGRGPSAT